MTLSVGFHPGLYFPDYERKGDRHVGLIPSFIEPFANANGFKLVYKNIPRKRMSSFLKSGDVQVRCLYAKEWVENPNDFYWSKVLFKGENVFIRLKDTAELEYTADLKGKSFAGILGYRYSPEINQLISEGSLTRNNVINMTSLKKMLTLKRADYALGSRRILRHLISDQPQIKFTKLVESRYDLHCAFSKTLPKKIIDDFNAFYDQKKIKKVLSQFN